MVNYIAICVIGCLVIAYFMLWGLILSDPAFPTYMGLMVKRLGEDCDFKKE